jgi:transcriptional regulator with XRE-family HTH domain
MAKKYLLLNKVYELRIIYDLSIKELAVASKLSESEISDIEKGLKQPTHPTMLKICKGFGVKFDEIFDTIPEDSKLFQ